jgi:cell division protease FtsH
MNLNTEQKNSIIEKHQYLESIRPILKKEFLGIDDVIDSTIDAIRPFYVFPETLKRPLIVNLWGMTGTGKTTLVERIVNLLHLGHQYCKFDVGEYATQSSDWKLRNDLSEKVEKCFTKNLVLAFDEFQFGRTINEKSEEVDRNTLRPMWDIIDSGIITSVSQRSFNVIQILRDYQNALSHGVKVEDGIVIQGEDVYNTIFSSNYLYEIDFSEVYITDADKKDKNDELWFEENGYNYYYASEYQSKMKKPYFVKKSHFDIFYNVNPEVFKNIKNFKMWCDKFRSGLNGSEILEFCEKAFIYSSSLMKKEDYSKSLIFCIGNIDEAYNMTHSTNPDADADVFYEHSLKITTPKIKEALSKRFRMEQIGRLGNTHIVYPSFNKKTYQQIINKYLNNRVDEYFDKFGIYLKFDHTVEDIIYKEGVFPTQGARPVLSTISALIDSYSALIISDIALNCSHCNSIVWKYIDDENPKFHIIAMDSFSSEEYEFYYPVKLNVEKLRKSDFTENQTSVAVHEAGHAVVAIMQTHLVPTETRSRTAGNSEGVTFLKIPENETKQSLYNSIMVFLGGLEAEKLVFGTEIMSAGGSSDLKSATTSAASMVKTYGMGDFMHQINTQSHGPHAIYNTDSNSNAESAIIEIIEKAKAETKKLLEDNMEFLLELSEYLSIRPTILEDELKTMASKYTNVFKEPDNYYGFKEKLAEKIKNVKKKKNKHKTLTSTKSESVAVFSKES